MSYTMSGNGAASAVSDKMKFGVKPSAVRSSSFLKIQKAASPSGNQVMSLGNQIIFDVPNLGTGYYIDWSTSYFRFGINVQLGTSLAGGGVHRDNGYVRFERGPESMFRRIEYQDYGGGTDLENFENYNDLYCLTELLTNNASNRSGVDTFHGEGFFHPNDLTDTKFDEANNGRNLPIGYPDLGGGIIGYNHAAAVGGAHRGVGVRRVPVRRGRVQDVDERGRQRLGDRQTVGLFLRAIAPVDAGRLAQGGHLGDPGDQLGMFDVGGGIDALQHGCVHGKGSRE